MNWALLAVLGEDPPRTIVINELTTVASAFTAAQFIHDESISGNPLGLHIAAGNVPNFVNLRTGKWGHVLLDPLNSTQTATLTTFDTLGSMITAFITSDERWRTRFLKAATPSAGPEPTSTIEAMADIARESWSASKELFALFDEAYRNQRMGPAAQRLSCGISPSFRPTSLSPYASPEAACTSMVASCSTRMETSGVGRTGCPVLNRA